ncbi:hypothetical protein GGR54DRAFT_372282 [Hypoxylon sp. NC1633]|nr:hypothetical protein GGR54DRAFT_372282 [Hypoxylon sp. NC1633]
MARHGTSDQHSPVVLQQHDIKAADQKPALDSTRPKQCCCIYLPADRSLVIACVCVCVCVCALRCVALRPRSRAAGRWLLLAFLPSSCIALPNRRGCSSWLYRETPFPPPMSGFSHPPRTRRIVVRGHRACRRGATRWFLYGPELCSAGVPCLGARYFAACCVVLCCVMVYRDTLVEHSGPARRKGSWLVGEDLGGARTIEYN